jgi:hypothetical protein
MWSILVFVLLLLQSVACEDEIIFYVFNTTDCSGYNIQEAPPPDECFENTQTGESIEYAVSDDVAELW